MSTKSTTIFVHQCLGCRYWQKINDEFSCANQLDWTATPREQPACHEMDEDFAAIDQDVSERIWLRARELREVGCVTRGELVLVSQVKAIQALMYGDDDEGQAKIELAAVLLAMRCDDALALAQPGPLVISGRTKQGESK